MLNLHEQLNKIMPLAATWITPGIKIIRNNKIIKTVRLLRGDYISHDCTIIIDVNDEDCENLYLIEDMQGNISGTVLQLILKNKGTNSILTL